MNAQLIKGGPALALVMIPSTESELGLVAGQWCAANIVSGSAPTIWEGPAGPPATPTGLPAVGSSSVSGSGTLRQPTAGNYTIEHITPCSTELNSKLFMMVGSQLMESQEYDLVDTATAPPIAPAVPTLAATPQLVGGVPSILLQGH